MEEEPYKRWSKAADEKVRKMFLSEGRAKCDEMVQAFVECSKTHGLWVVLRCRDQNKAMNACVSQYTTDEKWKSFRNAKISEYLDEGKLTIRPSDAWMGPPK